MIRREHNTDYGLISEVNKLPVASFRRETVFHCTESNEEQGEEERFFFERLKLIPWEGGREKKVLHGCRGMLVTRAGGGSEFIPVHALLPGWRSKLGE